MRNPELYSKVEEENGKHYRFIRVGMPCDWSASKAIVLGEVIASIIGSSVINNGSDLANDLWELLSVLPLSKDQFCQAIYELSERGLT